MSLQRAFRHRLVGDGVAQIDQAVQDRAHLVWRAAQGGAALVVERADQRSGDLVPVRQLQGDTPGQDCGDRPGPDRDQETGGRIVTFFAATGGQGHGAA